MSVTLLQFPSRKGYSRRELCYLAVCLGYPSSLFTNGFESARGPVLQAAHKRLQSGKRVSEDVLWQLLDSKILDDKLDKLYNKYPAKYNAELVKRAHSMLKHRTLTFKEISDARIAFELYAREDGEGMEADGGTVLQAAKMMDRIMSPIRMEAEVQKHREASEVPGRFQIFEFLDLVGMCETTQEVERRLSSSCILEHTQDTGSSLPNFTEMLLTPDQKCSKYLDEHYRASLHTPVDQTPSVTDTDHNVDRTTRRALLTRSSKQIRAITPSLELSTSQLKQARNGHLTFSSEQFTQCVSRRDLTRKQLVKDPLTDSSSESCHRGMLPRRKRLRFRFQRIPRSLPGVEQKPPEVDLKMTSEPGTGSSEEVDLSHAISAMCVASVLRARNTLKSSYDSVTVQHSTPPTHSLTTAVTASRMTNSKLSPKANNDSAVGRSTKPRVEAVVSRKALERHQGLIDDLEWKALRSCQV